MWEKVKNSYSHDFLQESFPKHFPFLKYIKTQTTRTKLIYFLGGKITDKFIFRKTYSLLYPNYLSKEQDSFIFKEIRIPLPDKVDEALFMREFPDIIFPYINTEITITKKVLNCLLCEYPYEIDENVCLKQNDIIIDCGANMGLFSAVASSKGCTIYAFEPFPYVIEKYLSITASWNKNINICQYALWHNEATLEFDQNFEVLGNSSAVLTQSVNKIKVQAIKLDDFAHRNNLPKVDFIKANIEVAERNMLLGAKEVIREFSPKISICTYHLEDDPKVLRESINSE